jgi:hypothetical protein
MGDSHRTRHLQLRGWRLIGAVAATVVAAGVACGTTGSVTLSQREIICNLYWAGGVVPNPPDGAKACAPGVTAAVCNYQTQSGCSGGQSCTPHLDGSTVVPACRAPGSVQRGQACDDTHLCGNGMVCAEGGCRQLCCGGDWSACAPGESCIHHLEMRASATSAPVDAGADLCFPVNDCDVFDPKACAAQGKICRIVDPTGAVACAPPSNLKVDDECDAADQCGQAMICADVNKDTGKGVCRKLCRWTLCGEPSCSKADGACVHFNRDPINVGECTPGWRDGPIVSDGGTFYGPDGAVLTPR